MGVGQLLNAKTTKSGSIERAIQHMYKGTSKDYLGKHMWISIAATNGYDRFIKRVENVEKKMSPEQIAKAQRLAREWMEEHQAKMDIGNT